MTPSGEPESAARVEAAKAILDEHATMALAGCDGDDPWAAKVFFVEDEPGVGRFDMCCLMLLNSRKLASLKGHPRLAFVVAGESADRWIQGTGTAEAVADEADADAVRKRLEEKTPAARAFFERVEWTAVRVHVDRLRVTDLSQRPPIAEFSFA